MQYVVTHLGVPIGAVELEDSELAVGQLEPFDAYEAVRTTIPRGSVSLGRTLRGPTAPPLEPDDKSVAIAESVGEAAALRFELRDDRGNQVATDFVNVIETHVEPVGVVSIGVFARFRGAPTGVTARRQPREGAGGEEGTLP
jgi:hypothetical protein